MTYTKISIEDGIYKEIHVEETVAVSLMITLPKESIYIVTHIGGYNQIRITDGETSFSCTNPFREYAGVMRDMREEKSKTLVAVNESRTTALDISSMKFNLSPEIMANLFYKVFIPNKDSNFWCGLTEELIDK